MPCEAARYACDRHRLSITNSDLHAKTVLEYLCEFPTASARRDSALRK